MGSRDVLEKEIEQMELKFWEGMRNNEKCYIFTKL